MSTTVVVPFPTPEERNRHSQIARRSRRSEATARAVAWTLAVVCGAAFAAGFTTLVVGGLAYRLVFGRRPRDRH